MPLLVVEFFVLYEKKKQKEMEIQVNQIKATAQVVNVQNNYPNNIACNNVENYNYAQGFNVVQENKNQGYNSIKDSSNVQGYNSIKGSNNVKGYTGGGGYNHLGVNTNDLPYSSWKAIN